MDSEEKEKQHTDRYRMIVSDLRLTVWDYYFLPRLTRDKRKVEASQHKQPGTKKRGVQEDVHKSVDSEQIIQWRKGRRTGRAGA